MNKLITWAWLVLLTIGLAAPSPARKLLSRPDFRKSKAKSKPKAETKAVHQWQPHLGAGIVTRIDPKGRWVIGWFEIYPIKANSICIALSKDAKPRAKLRVTRHQKKRSVGLVLLEGKLKAGDRLIVLPEALQQKGSLLDIQAGQGKNLKNPPKLSPLKPDASPK